MRRSVVVLGVLLALGASVPARAYDGSGRIRFAAVSPSVPRTMYLMDRHSNGWAGYVMRLDGNPRSYTLTLTDGAFGFEDLDAYFYVDIDGTGTPCQVSSTQRRDVETGSITCSGGAEARWAVIVLAQGANASFTLTT